MGAYGHWGGYSWAGQRAFRNSLYLPLNFALNLKLTLKKSVLKQLRSLPTEQESLLALLPGTLQEEVLSHKGRQPLPETTCKPQAVQSELSSGAGGVQRALRGPTGHSKGVLTCCRGRSRPATAGPCGGRPSPAPGSACPARCSAAGSSASPALGPARTGRGRGRGWDGSPAGRAWHGPLLQAEQLPSRVTADSGVLRAELTVQRGQVNPRDVFQRAGERHTFPASSR